MLQYDQTAAVAPSADLVAWSRIGSSYEPAELADALEYRTLVDLRGIIRPREDTPCTGPRWRPGTPARSSATWKRNGRAWAANDACRRDVLAGWTSIGRCRSRRPGHLRGAVGLVGWNKSATWPCSSS